MILELAMADVVVLEAISLIAITVELAFVPDRLWLICYLLWEIVHPVKVFQINIVDLT